MTEVGERTLEEVLVRYYLVKELLCWVLQLLLGQVSSSNDYGYN